MNHKEHLPIYGVGPFYGLTVIGITVVLIILNTMGYMQAGHSMELIVRIVLRILGCALILLGIYLWCAAVMGKDGIDHCVVENRLRTTGVYGIVRNPCYSSVMFICSGVLCLLANWYVLLAPLFYWLFMTVLMKFTEEKWLVKQYGQEYKTYCQQVNRCIPRFLKHH